MHRYQKSTLHKSTFVSSMKGYYFYEIWGWQIQDCIGKLLFAVISILHVENE